MSDALDAHVQIKAPDKSRRLAPHAKLKVAYLIECLGDRPLDCFNGRDVVTFRDPLVGKGLGRSSLKSCFLFEKPRIFLNLRISDSKRDRSLHGGRKDPFWGG